LNGLSPARLSGPGEFPGCHKENYIDNPPLKRTAISCIGSFGMKAITSAAARQNISKAIAD
jgi:hypothetical protein